MEKKMIITNPKITVITPTYNRKNLIVETIESVLKQDYRDFEYLILDDGSTDDTESFIKPYLSDKRVKYFKHENSGEAETVNWGWSMAKGEYFTQVNSDDPILPGLFSEMVKAMDVRPDVVVSYPDFYIIDDDGKILKEERSPDWVFEEALSSYSCYAASAGTFVRIKSFKDWKKIKTTNFKHISDVEMYWNMAKIGDFLHVPKILATWRSHEGAISAERYKSIPEIHRWFHGYFSDKDLPEHIKSCKLKTKKSIDKYCVSLLKESNAEDKDLLIKQYESQYKYEYKNLQIGDNDLIGNKFNGHNLHLYLRENGVDSSQLVWNKESQDETTYIIAGDKGERGSIREQTEKIQRIYNTNGIYNPLFLDILYNQLYLEADVVHLHLMHNGLIDLHLLPILTQLKPVVWTIHDPWVFSGHCIEHFNCTRWQDLCKNCPALDVPFPLIKDNSTLNFILKKTALQNAKFDVIVASQMMYEKVKQSSNFSNKRVHLVPFGIDQNIFCKKNKEDVRKKLGISNDAFVIFFRADTRHKKGVEYIEHVLDHMKFSGKIVLLVVGGSPKKKNEKHTYVEYGWLKDDYAMADLYNAADLFLMPSLVESFGLMAIEAMSCGVLPIVLDGTALPAVVNAPECGITVKRDKSAYADVVQYYLDHAAEREIRAAKCFEFAKEKYNKHDYVERIMKVYKTAMHEHSISNENNILLEQLKKNMMISPVLDVQNENKSNVEQKKIKTYNYADLKNHVRQQLKKIVWTVSPAFRMLSGNKKRMNILLEKVEKMQCAQDEMKEFQDVIQNLYSEQGELEKKIDYRMNVLLEKIDYRNRIELRHHYNENKNLYGDVIVTKNEGLKNINVYSCNGEEFFEKMKKHILDTDVVLDIGTGIRPQTFFSPKVHICIEPFEQYRKTVRPFFPNRSHFVFMKGDALESLRMLDDDSVDSVFMIDLIEHLEKDQGKNLLREADRVARKQIIVFTPFGFYPMHYEKKDKDAWGLDGSEFQEHKSGWLPEDFGDSWSFYVCKDCHEAFLLEEKKQGKKYSALMAIRTKDFGGFQCVENTPKFIEELYVERMKNE